MNQPLNRRRFLELMGAAMALPGQPWAHALANDRTTDADPWRLRLSTSSIHFKGLPIEQACERIAKLGFEAIDIWSAHENCPHLDDVATRLGVDGLRALLERADGSLWIGSIVRR